MNFFQRIPLFFYNLIYPSKIIGKENIPADGAVIACNHYSFLDPAYLLNLSNKNLFFLAKEELFEKKLTGKFLASYGGVPVNREKPSMKTLLFCVRILKEGKKLVIFPEGTRNKSKNGELQDIKGGSVVFAIKSKTPIIPVMFLRKPRIFHKTYIKVGKPFELTQFYDKKLVEQDIIFLDCLLKDKMIEQHNELKNSVLKKKKCKY